MRKLLILFGQMIMYFLAGMMLIFMMYPHIFQR